MSNSLDPDQDHDLSVIIWGQTVYKGYQQTTLGGKKLKSNFHYRIQIANFLILCMLYNFSCFVCLFSNSLDPDQDRHYVCPKTVWIQIRTDIMSVLIWVKTVCKCYQQTTKDAGGKERVKGTDEISYFKTGRQFPWNIKSYK